MPVTPFNTPEEIQQKADRFAQYQTGLFDIDYGLQKLSADTSFQKAGIDRNLRHDVSQTIDQMIARGLYQSSIKDGEVNDLNATAAMRKQYLDTTLNSATIDAGRRKQVLSDQWNSFLNTLNQLAVQHAQDIPPTPTPAAPAGGGGGGTPAPNFVGRIGNQFVGPQMWDPRGFYVIPRYQSPSGKVGTLHVYQNGHQVFVQ